MATENDLQPRTNEHRDVVLSRLEENEPTMVRVRQYAHGVIKEMAFVGVEDKHYIFASGWRNRQVLRATRDNITSEANGLTLRNFNAEEYGEGTNGYDAISDKMTEADYFNKTGV